MADVVITVKEANQIRDNYLIQHYKALRSQENDNGKWILEPQFASKCVDLKPPWTLVKDLSDDFFEALLRNLETRSTYPLQHAWLATIEAKYKLSKIVSWKLVNPEIKPQIYNLLVQKTTALQNFNFTPDQLEFFWSKYGKPEIEANYYPILNHLRDLYVNYLSNRSCLGLLRSVYSKCNFEYDNYCETIIYKVLEGRIITMQVDPVTLKPIILDKIVLDVDDLELDQFLYGFLNIPELLSFPEPKSSETRDPVSETRDPVSETRNPVADEH